MTQIFSLILRRFMLLTRKQGQSQERKLCVPEGKKRDRRNDLLLIRDGGESFRIIDKTKGRCHHYHPKRRVGQVKARSGEAFREAQRLRLLELVLKKKSHWICCREL